MRYTNRNRAIFERVLNGVTLRAAGQEYDLSTERVRQICAKMARNCRKAGENPPDVRSLADVRANKDFYVLTMNLFEPVI